MGPPRDTLPIAAVEVVLFYLFNLKIAHFENIRQIGKIKKKRKLVLSPAAWSCSEGLAGLACFRASGPTPEPVPRCSAPGASPAGPMPSLTVGPAAWEACQEEGECGWGT